MKYYLRVGLISVLMCIGVLPACADNEKISMVTFFPVQYAAYNNIYTTEKFDVGTRNGSFTLNLGNSTCTGGLSLDADEVFLRSIGSSSVLSFDTDLYTPTAIFGDLTITPDTLGINFRKNLRVKNLGKQEQFAKEVKTDTATGTIEVERDVYLFSNAFSGKVALPQCEGPVTWQQVTTNSGMHWYLVCD